jgi:hypothetical protein
MKTITETITNIVYQSEFLPEIRTLNPSLARTIAWADDHPVVWRIVTSRRSKAFGLGSCEYIGWAQKSMEPDAVLERARHIHELGEGKCPYHDPDSIFVWRAKFTLEHFQDKRFTGGFFQQHDAKYPRSCVTLDYTPETFQEVLDRFCAWMDRCYDTDHITVNGQVVRTFATKEEDDAETIVATTT